LLLVVTSHYLFITWSSLPTTYHHQDNNITTMSKSTKFVRGIESICLHGGYLPDATTSRGVPLYRTAPYVFESTEKAAALFGLKELGNIYSRIMNPTNDVLEQRFSAMQGAAASLALSSGTAAAFSSIINLAEQGDNFVSARNLYGGTYTQFNDILPKFGIQPKFVDIVDPAAVKAAIDDNTRAIFCESVSNPALEISPLEELSAIAAEYKLPLIVDDTFTTPYLCKPIADWGANVVVHSLTKWTGGHGTAIGGIVADGANFDWTTNKMYTEHDTSYGGLRWGMDLPPELAPVAYILRMRTVPLRNLGSCLSPDNA
jgi:O-acetylhomoserine (thiol)-lyase